MQSVIPTDYLLLIGVSSLSAQLLSPWLGRALVQVGLLYYIVRGLGGFETYV